MVLAAWSLGIIGALLLSPLWPWLALAIAGTGAAVVVDRRLAIVALLALIAMLLGAARAGLTPPVALPPGVAGQAVALAGQVDDDPVLRHNALRLSIRVDRLQTVRSQGTHGFRVQATVYGATPVHYGDLVLLSGRLDVPPAFDTFDYRAYLAEQGIVGVMTSARLVRVTAHPGDPFHTALFAVRHALVQSVDHGLPEPQAALLLGVVFGYRATLPVTLEQQMIASGLIHIVVISGLKVSLLARILQQTLGRVLPRAAPVIALGAMVVYALLAGASAAALRAAAMGALVVIAGRLHRDSHVYTSLALTGAVMLGLKPDLARDVSFQLSFAGTLGIAGMTDGIARRLRWIPAALRDPFAATIAAEAATWPLMLANFHQLSIVAPLANALVLPLLPAMMVVGGGGAIVGIGPAALAWPALQAAGAMAHWMAGVIQVLGGLPLAALVAPYFPGRWLAAAVLLNGGALVAIKLRHLLWRRAVWVALGGALLVAVAVLLVRPDGRVHVYALDVGNGSAVLVRTANGQQVLIDAGPDGDRFAQAIGRALPPTARDLTAWILTGGRRTQLGAASAVLSRFSVRRLVVADRDPWSASLRTVVEQAGAAGIAVDPTAQPVEVDGVRIAPAGDGRTWLITAGTALVAVIPPDGDWHRAGGVGGTIFTSGGPADWDQLSPPCLAVIQVAPRRAGGLPSYALVDRLRSCQTLRTDQLGNVELVEADGRFSIP